MCTGDVREFSVLPVHDVNELDEVEAVQLQIAQEGPAESRLTAEQEARIDDIFDKVLREGENVSEPAAFENLLLGCQLSPRDFRGEPYFNGADDMVCLYFPRVLPINIFFPGDNSFPCQQWQVHGRRRHCCVARNGGEASVTWPLLAGHEGEVPTLHPQEP